MRAAKKTEEDTPSALNFKVPPSFRRQYKLYAVTKGMTMTELLQQSFAHFKQRRK